MTEYQFVIISEDVAFQYYQSEDKLYRLFKDYQESYDWAKPLLNKQIQYITKNDWHTGWTIPKRGQLQAIGFYEEEISSGYKYYSKHSGSTLYVHSHCAIYQHAGEKKEEWQVFDAIGKVSPYVFAVCLEKEKYGWLKPLKVFSVL